MPNIDTSDLNVVLGVLGIFIVFYGMLSVKIKSAWYLGEALPAVIFGIIVGPLAARFLDASEWGSAIKGQQDAITLGLTRVVIGVQLVIAGFQLPSKYFYKKWLPMLLCLIPLMTIMWLFTTGCVMITIPRLSLLSAMVIASCVTCTDPVLSQAVAKGPFADKFVPRPVREIISAEAASNDGFGFPFLMLATYLLRHASNPKLTAPKGAALITRSESVERLGGGVGIALHNWVLETWLYYVLMGLLYGALLGFASCWTVKYAMKRKWIDTESYLLLPTGLGLLIIGTCGAMGTGDFLACTIAGAALNWDGEYLTETIKLHDEVNSSLDLLLNFGGFMYLGTIIPFKEFHQPETTGLSIGILFALGVLVLFFRRIPGVLILYRAMPSCVANWKEALFMGYFGPIGIGAVFYVEHTKLLFPKKSELNPADEEIHNLLTFLVPVVYFLVLFSIIVHGLSIPLLNQFYLLRGVEPIREDNPVEMSVLSSNIALPNNATTSLSRRSIVVRSMTVHNRFSVPVPGIVTSRMIQDEMSEEAIARWNERGRELRFQMPKTRRSSSGETAVNSGSSSAEHMV